MPVTRILMPLGRQTCATCGQMIGPEAKTARYAGLSRPDHDFPGICGIAGEKPAQGLLRCPAQTRPEVDGADGEARQGDVRGMLFPAQPAVRAEPRRALRDVPTGQPGRAAPAAPAALHLPRAAPHARRLRLPERGGAGAAPRLRRRLTSTAT